MKLLLVAGGYFSIVLPHVVFWEWISQRKEDHAAVIDDFSRSHKKLAAQLWMSESVRTEWVRPQEEVSAHLNSRMSEAVDRTVAEWALSMKLEVVDSTAEDLEAVFKSYFRGDPPFSGPRHREDIPDAFIFEAAKRRSRPLICITSDKRLGSALAALPRTVCFESVSELLSSEIGQHAQAELRVESLWTKQVQQEIFQLLREKRKDLAQIVGQQIAEELVATTVSSATIPSDEHTAEITDVESVDSVDFSWNQIEDLGPAWFSISFDALVSVTLEFMVYRGDSFHVPNWVDVSVGDFETDYYFEATGSRQLAVSGTVEVQLTESEIEAQPRTLPEQVALIDIESIEVLEADDDETVGIQNDWDESEEDDLPTSQPQDVEVEFATDEDGHAIDDEDEAG